MSRERYPQGRHLCATHTLDQCTKTEERHTTPIEMAHTLRGRSTHNDTTKQLSYTPPTTVIEQSSTNTKEAIEEP